MRWSYDFSNNYSAQSFTVGNQTPYYFNESDSEYTVAEFTAGQSTSRPPINATGAGSVITIGLESDIGGAPLSLQEVNVLALIGKTL